MASTLTSGTNGGAAYVMSRLFGGSPVSQITTYYLVVFVGTPPTDDTISNECTDGTYTRKALAISGLTITGNVATNTADIIWDAAFTGSVTVLDVGLATLSTGGYLHCVKATTGGSVVVGAGDIFKIPAGDLSINIPTL